MGLLIDSFWRAAAYCLRPRVIALSLLPLLLIALLAWGAGALWWTSSVAAVQQSLQTSSWLGLLWGWLRQFGIADAPSVLAPLLVIVAATPVIVLIAVLAVALMMTPALVRLVAERRFPALERKRGGSLLGSLAWSLGSTAAALLAMVVSMPLWLVPPLVLVLPPLIWGWLTYRVMSFDALADHASKEERVLLLKRHHVSLLTMGVVCGYLGAAPGIVWASGVVFAAAFFVLVPVAVWIYTLVFAFSSLWFTHYALAALERLRRERGEPPVAAAPVADAAASATTPSAALPAPSSASNPLSSTQP
ncbi:EI24 domain-containing protein [Paracidovorax wautersii]|uniref:Etoposide-induced protein 2.4 (EI24) n=1 Tax=Paracidovorax wautersii TaxID=1177982 RepID=A0A1I2DUB1_9BURK|nr:EI24 domain-containing protein [Paracidovorax wautersii]SFE84008.1 Etoposide-induced protein 2.4 (EI24) [Paracidovorax wautersii]